LEAEDGSRLSENAEDGATEVQQSTIPSRGCRVTELRRSAPINLFDDGDNTATAVRAYVDRRENRSKRL